MRHMYEPGAPNYYQTGYPPYAMRSQHPDYPYMNYRYSDDDYYPEKHRRHRRRRERDCRDDEYYGPMPPPYPPPYMNQDAMYQDDGQMYQGYMPPPYPYGEEQYQPQMYGGPQGLLSKAGPLLEIFRILAPQLLGIGSIFPFGK